MEWVEVQFPATRDVFIGNRLVGATNTLLTTREGPQTIHLGPGGGYKPRERRVNVTGTAADDPMTVIFSRS
ncbi:MAG: hypothetical protein ACREKH_18725 [Candidatus Rokuibacteriota bacterium]